MTSQLYKALKSLLFYAALFAVVVIIDYKCPIKALFGIACPGCGMVRAWLSVLKLDFKSAFYYHPLFFVAPLIPPLMSLPKKSGKRAQNLIVFLAGLLFFCIYLFRITRHFPDVL
ncbi:MAG TPA: DUF2752 domain-containing protein [Clostridiales bacterium]|nr:DUF2752 domain-containing protein [Clostridiales bacterium]